MVENEAPSNSSAPNLPTGTVTFLFTDIEGSTILLQELGDRYPELLAEQREILRQAFSQHNGSEVDTQGDAFFYAFPRATDAVLAAVAAQEAISRREWPADVQLRVRMGLHTGETLEIGPEGYVGMDVHRAARIAHAGHGGQILLSASTTALVEHDLPGELQLKDLGEHRLKDLRHPLHLFQLRSEELPSEFPPLRSLNVLPNNLPHQLSTFIGRRGEIERVMGLLGESRLVTLVGPGGAGKSRLSLQVAANLVDQYQDGVWFVELAAIDSPQFLISAMVSALPFQIDVHSSDLSPEAQLLDYLSRRSCLLLMDNFEHLVSGGELLPRILEMAPGVRFLVTSRERLNLKEEWVFDLAGMSFPENGHRGDLTRFSSVNLFIERARQTISGFELTPDRLEAIVRICKLVEGMPLALELAAAWLRTLSVEEIAGEIENNLDILRSSARNQADKHRSLRAVFDHSWKLLSDDERDGFQKLSIFRGGFTRQAAEQVAGVDLLLLSSLTDKSLIRRDSVGRYAIHELLRQYAWEKLNQVEDTLRAAHDRHFRYYLRYMTERKPLLDTPRALEARDEILLEINNIRFATFYAIRSADEADARQMLAHLAAFYNLHGFQEGVEAFQSIVDQLESSDGSQPVSSVLLTARVYLGSLMSTVGIEVGEGLARSSLEEIRARSLWQELGVCLHALGIYAEIRSAYDEAIEYLVEALDLIKKGDDIFFITSVLLWLGWAYYEKGDYDQAEEHFTTALDLCSKTGQRVGEAFSLSKLGTLADARHAYQQALDYHQRALDIFLEYDDAAGQGYALSRMSLSAWGIGDFTNAGKYGEEGLAQFESIGHRWGIATSLCRIGFAVLGKGEMTGALDYFYRGLDRSLEYKYLATTIYALIGVACVWCRAGELKRGAELLHFALGQPATPGLYRDIAQKELDRIQPRLDGEDLRSIASDAARLEMGKVVEDVIRSRAAADIEGLEVQSG